MVQLELGTPRKVFCNTCEVETHHKLKAVHRRYWDEWLNGRHESAQATYWEEFEYRLWVCCGCDTATLEEASTNIGKLGPDGREWQSVYFPKRARRHWPLKRFRQLDGKLARIYREAVESFNAELEILCAVGLRALLEGICADKAITGGNLKQKIEKMHSLLPSSIVHSLHGFRFMGNEAAHELQAPRESELRLAIEVIEDILNFLYELDHKARRLLKQ